MADQQSNATVLPSATYVARADVVASDIGGHWALLDLDSSLYYTLNETGAKVWNSMQRPASLDQLVEVVKDHFVVADEICRPDVAALLDDLVKSGLVRREDNQGAAAT